MGYGRLLVAERDLRIDGTRAVFISREVEIGGGKLIITVRRAVYTVHIMQC